MGKIIYFIEDPARKCVIRFVKEYKRSRILRREKIQYTVSLEDSKFFYGQDEKTEIKVVERIKRDYPNADIHCEDSHLFEEKFQNHRFWVICRANESNSVLDFYDGTDSNRKPTYTNDMECVRMMMSETVVLETLSTIQRCTRDRAYYAVVYLNLINELLTPVMMITCTRKATGETKYLARVEDNRLRLVKTSGAAAKFSYDKVVALWDYLKQHNKGFLYAVLPEFKDNVNCKDIENYMRNNNVSRMIVMDLQLKFLNR